MKRLPPSAVLLLLIFTAAAAQGTGLDSDATRELLRGSIEQIHSGSEVRIGDASIAAVRVLPEFYERRNFRLAWTDPRDIEELLQRLDTVHTEGLDARDYHTAEIRRLRTDAGSTADPTLAVGLDLLLTDSLIRLGYHLLYGKVNPEEFDADWNFSRDLADRDPATALQNALDAESLDGFLSELTPRGLFYTRLRTALDKYRAIAAAGGWPTVTDGPVLKPGASDPRVVAVRRRLAATGDLKLPRTVDHELYDEALEAAVTRFQHRHGLAADGVLGPDTLREMNVSAAARVDQIRVNLERARWVFRDVVDDFILVNIAGFKVHLVRDRKLAWTARAQVGKPYRKTPVFKSTMEYLVFNPTWTVPPTILAKDILPRASKDPQYLHRKNIDVIDRDGKILDPASVNWGAYASGGFPYTMRQRPGPANALGRVKFIFPNEHFVFLHDTPSRELFDRADRTFSSGCIRVENPLELAELLLDDEANWIAEQIQAVLDGGKTRTVFLQEPLPVMILYWTATVEDDGTIVFMKDVYQRDQRVLDGLDAAFAFSPVLGGPDYLHRAP
jgi:murein L,D-transpeptidase YcbB/YkuD